MRNLLIALLLSLTLSLSGATYYVATNGSDSNPGSLTQPWLTLQKGFNSISAGDILYVRGGTYSPSGTIAGGLISGVVVNGKKGSASSMYSVFAYPGETPILDCRNITNTSYSRIGILILSSSYWYIKGIEITRVDQSRSPVNGGQGLLIQSGNYNKIEAVVSHHNGGPGLGLRDESEGNVFLNCDAYSNYDPYTSTPGDDADGFDIGFITARSGNDRVNTLIGCRSWLNSDDGFDMYQYPGYHGIYILKECWAFRNGYKTDGTTDAGDGNGFKYGSDNNYSLDAVVRRSTYNCIAYANRQRGYSQESANVKMLFYNNIAYKNGSWGFSFYYYDVADVLRNNISYKNTDGTIENQGSNRVHDHNSWDSKVTLTDADFAGLDATQLTTARKSDGSLPDIAFLHIATGSDLIDAGVNVGLPYVSTAPDMGPFESGTASTAVAPVYLSSSVENGSPTILTMNYDQDLNTLVVPSASSFSVVVNSAARTVSSVSISGKKVLLTLSSAAKYGDVIFVSYTVPSANPLQTAAGKYAAAISSQSVTNNVIAPVPVYVSSVIANATPSVLEMTYNMTLAGITPAASSFNVLVNSVKRTVTAVTISAAKVLLTLASPVVYGDNVTVSYTKPSASPLQTSLGAQAAALSAQKVTNNTANTANTPPAIIITAPANNSSYIAPASFTIMANASDADGSVALVEFYSGTTRIGSKSSAPYSFTWNNVAAGNYNITAVVTDNLGAKTTSELVTVSVTDGTPPPPENLAPTVSIASPAKGNKFDSPADIEISITAADADGNVASVDLFEGTDKIATLTSAPWSYTWKGVSSGTYNITAVATDNDAAKTTSGIVEFTVGNKPVYDGNSDVVNLYPNPSDGHFTIDFIVPLKNAKNEIIISDLRGNQVYRDVVTSEETTKQIEIPNSRSGLYILTVISDEILVTKKILIK